MKLLLAVFMVSACGTYHMNRINPKGQDGSSCTTRQDSVGVYVECSDGTDSFITFPKNGEPGQDGSSCAVSDTGLVQCTDGSAYQIENGEDGEPGQSCLLQERNVTCRSHTKKFKQFLVCPNAEVYIKDVTVRSGC